MTKIHLTEIGYNYLKSMSNNAVLAYERGERPEFEWSKDIILDTITDMTSQEVSDIFSVLPYNVLKDFFLFDCGWHHIATEKDYYDKVYFYTIYDRVKELNVSKANAIMEYYNQYVADSIDYENEKDKLFKFGTKLDVTTKRGDTYRLDISPNMISLITDDTSHETGWGIHTVIPPHLIKNLPSKIYDFLTDCLEYGVIYSPKRNSIRVDSIDTPNMRIIDNEDGIVLRILNKTKTPVWEDIEVYKGLFVEDLYVNEVILSIDKSPNMRDYVEWYSDKLDEEYKEMMNTLI